MYVCMYVCIGNSLSDPSDHLLRCVCEDEALHDEQHPRNILLHSVHREDFGGQLLDWRHSPYRPVLL